MAYKDRLNFTLSFVAPAFDELIKKDFENLLKDFEENPKSKDADGKDKSQDKDGGEKKGGESGSNKPKTLDEFLESLENQTSSQDTTFFENEDPNGKAMPSAFKPQTPEEVEKIKEKIREVLEKIKEENATESIEEKRAKEFLSKNPKVTPESYNSYQNMKSSVAEYSKELSKFWGELLGRQRELRKISSHLAESGSKMNTNAVIRNFSSLSQGVPIKIFEKTVRGYQEGNEKPREVRFRIVLDRSGSMADGGRLEVLKQMYTVLMESFQNYKTRAKISGAIKDGTFIDFRTECWGYGSEVESMKQLSPVMEINEQAVIISTFAKIIPNMGNTLDEHMIATLDKKITQDRNISNKSDKKSLDVIFYFTDGSPSNIDAVNETLNNIDTKNVLWRAFQIESDSPEFDTIWNGQTNTKGSPVTLETMIPTVIKQLEEIVNSL
jgi:hypothetical protein